MSKKTWHNLKGDVIGGVTVAFVALPLALSFGVLSGAGAAAGVYGAIFHRYFAFYLWWNYGSRFQDLQEL